MKNVGIERSVPDIHRSVAHGLKTRSPRRTKQVAAGYLRESSGARGERNSYLTKLAQKYHEIDMTI